MKEPKRKPYVHQLFYLKKDGTLGRQFAEIETKVKFRQFMISYYATNPTKVVFSLKGERIFRQVHHWVSRGKPTIVFSRWRSPEKERSMTELEGFSDTPSKKFKKNYKDDPF